MKKSLSALLLVVFLIPSIAFASWWNPISWFNNWTFRKPEPQVQVVENLLINEPDQSLEPISDSFSLETSLEMPKEPQNITPNTKNIESKNTNILIPSQPVQIVPAVITQQDTQSLPENTISIYEIFVSPSSNSVEVSWKTSIPTESKILIEGRSFISVRGIGIIHKTTITGLDSEMDYSGSITAIANNAWKSENFTFTTKKTPLSIQQSSHNCQTESCSFFWKTNYETNSNIKIFKKDSSDLVKSLNSNTESREHSVNLKLEPSTYYTFEIYATTDNEYVETNGEFKTPEIAPEILSPCLNHACP